MTALLLIVLKPTYYKVAHGPKIKDSWGNDRLGFYQDDKLVAVARCSYSTTTSWILYDLHSTRSDHGLPG